MPGFDAAVEKEMMDDVACNGQKLKIEIPKTPSQFRSPRKEGFSSPVHDAPCNAVQPSVSIGGCSTLSHSFSSVGKGKGSSLVGSASGLTATQTQSVSESSSSFVDTFGSSCEDDSDYTLTVGSYTFSSYTYDSLALSGYTSSMLEEDDTMGSRSYRSGSSSGSCD